MRPTTLKVKITEPTVLQSVDDLLRSKWSAVEVVDVLDAFVLGDTDKDDPDKTNFGGLNKANVVEQVIYIIAADGRYTAEDLNHVMGSLIHPFFANSDKRHSLYVHWSRDLGSPHEVGWFKPNVPRYLEFGYFTLSEKVGKRIVAIVPEDQRLRADAQSNSYNRDTALMPTLSMPMEEDVYRRIGVFLFPNNRYARDVLHLNPFDPRIRKADIVSALAQASGFGFSQVSDKVLQQYAK